MEEKSLREMAIEQILHDKQPGSIYREVGRSKYWFFEWLQRNRSGEANYFQAGFIRPLTLTHMGLYVRGGRNYV